MRIVVVLAALLTAAVPPPAFGADASASPPPTVEDVRGRHQLLRQQAGQLDKWVDEHWDEVFSQWYPALDRDPRRAKEPEKAYRERETPTRLAIAELKDRLRTERKEPIERERQALFAQEIYQPVAARLGPYDSERGVDPLLLGFGWPAGLAVTLRVPERDNDTFAAAFPPDPAGRFPDQRQGGGLPRLPRQGDGGH